MSQHVLVTVSAAGQNVEVTLGFDRPLGHFFLDVVRLGSVCPTGQVESSALDEEEEDESLYSNLDEAEAFNKDLDYYAAKLKELGIVAPAAMFEQVFLDSCFGVGNRFVRYLADGQVIES